MPRMTVNDRPIEFDLDPDMPLLYCFTRCVRLPTSPAPRAAAVAIALARAW